MATGECVRSLSSSAGRVLCVGPRARQASAYIEGVRGWSVSTVPKFDDVTSVLCESSRSAIVVVDLAEVTADSLIRIAHAVAIHAPDLAFSLLYGRGDEQLLDAAKRLPSVPDRGDHLGSQLFFDALGVLPLGAQRADIQTIPASSIETRERLTHRGDILYLAGHSNGIDLGISSAVLCRHADATAAETEFRVLPCYHGDTCRRGNDIDASADRVRARLVINLTCWGVYLAASHFAPEFTIGDSLMRFAGVESMVTTLRIVYITPPDGACLYYLVNMGLPMGLVANRANRFRLSLGQEAEYICFGDPLSSIKKRVSEVPVQWAGNKCTIDMSNHSAVAGSRDICFRRPSRGLPVNPLVVTSCGSIKSAFFDPNGTLEVNEDSEAPDQACTVYATVDLTSKTNSVALGLVDRHELPILDSMPARLLHDLGFLAIYAAGARGTTNRPDLEGKLGIMVEQLTRMLETWAVADLPPGSWIHWQALDYLHDTLVIWLLSLYDAVEAHYVEFVRTRTTHTMEFWSKAFGRGMAEAASTACAYCGQSVDVRAHPLRVGSGRVRRVSYCCGCGMVCDGEPDMVQWIETKDEVTPGDEITAALRVRNPYGFELPTRAVVIFEDFSRRETTVSSMADLHLPQSGRIMETTVFVPPSVFPGMHSLGAMAIVGARINFLRRLIRVAK